MDDWSSRRVGQHEDADDPGGRHGFQRGRRGGGRGRGSGRSSTHHPHHNNSASSSSFNGDPARGKQRRAFENNLRPPYSPLREGDSVRSSFSMPPLNYPSMGGDGSGRIPHGYNDNMLQQHHGSHGNMTMLYHGPHENMPLQYHGTHDNNPSQYSPSTQEASGRIPHSSTDKRKQAENECDSLKLNQNHVGGPASGALSTGIVVTVLKDRAFLKPKADQKNIYHGEAMDAANSQRDVSFLLQGRGTFTGLMDPHTGDVFQYISNGFSERPRAIFACLIACTPRSSTALAQYVQSLLTRCQEGHMDQKGTLQSSSFPITHQEEEEVQSWSENFPTGFAAYSRSLITRRSQGGPKVEGRILPFSPLPNIHQQEENTAAMPGGGGEIVLREITKCPAGILLVLQQPHPTRDIITCLIKLSLSLSNYSTQLYMAQLRKFYKLFHGSQFLLSPHALQKYIAKLSANDAENDYGDGNGYKDRLIFPFLLTLAKSSPEILPSLLPLVQITTTHHTDEDFEFLFDIFKIFSYDKGAPSDLFWDKIPLIPLRGELQQNAATPSQHNQCKTHVIS